MNTASGAKMTKLSQNEIPKPIVSFKRQIVPLGLNAKRVSPSVLAEAPKKPRWKSGRTCRRVVAHVSVAETDRRQARRVLQRMSRLAGARVRSQHTVPGYAGKPNGNWLPVSCSTSDSIAGIMKTATDAAIILKPAAHGFTLKVRPNGAMVSPLTVWPAARCRS